MALETATTKSVSDRATDMICKPGTDTTVVSLLYHAIIQKDPTLFKSFTKML